LRRFGVGGALVLLLLAGAGLRLWNINWDQFQHVHPDERYIVWVADSLSVPLDLATALDPLRSTINPFRWPPGHGDEAGKPRSYSYGHFPLYLLVVIAHAGQAAGAWFGETTLAFPAALQPLHTVGRHLAEYNYLALVGRALSAACDLGVLLLVYALARRAYGLRAGLLAATAYAFAVLPIQLSHFYAVDVVLTFCVMATLAAAARWAAAVWGDGLNRRGAALIAGCFFGLAVGSKFSAILLGLPLAAAAWLACRHVPGASQVPGTFDASTSRGFRNTELVRLIAALSVAVVVFLLTNPFAVIEWRAFASDILAQNTMVSGLMDAPYTRQYIGTLPYWYFIQQLSQWGLGWPLGLAAWGGLIWAAARFGLGRTNRTEIVLLAWALPYFALTGAFHAKFLRYMAPLLPLLLIFVAGGAVAAQRWLAGRWGRRGRMAWSAAVTVILATAIGWALAFTGVYRQEHPWLRASRWIFTNIPADSKLLTEHWDDALPLIMDEVPGRPPLRAYRRVELPLYDPDTRAKLDRLADELSSADYLILASNRLSAPLSRLAGRYPMTSNYYRLLAAGELGYTPVAEFTAYPRLLGFAIPDDHADESFTVYDHPRAVIYQNMRRLSAGLLRMRLGRYLPRETSFRFLPWPAPGTTGRAISDRASSRALAGARNNGACYLRPSQLPCSGCTPAEPIETSRPPGHAHYLPQPPAPDAPLTLAEPVDTLPVVADFRWNVFASENPGVAVILWWLVLSLLGWAAWPLLFPLCGALPDRGYGLARAAGWLLAGWIHWLAVSLGLWQNRLAPIAVVCAALIVAGVVAWRMQQAALGHFWSAQRRALLMGEAVFAGAYLAFVGIRLLNPDLWQPWNGGEKFMESAFLNAILRSARFPPYDPFFAGGALNYYYYGLYLVSLLIKLTGIFPEVAFNLAVPGLFALTAVGLFSVGSALAGWRQESGGRMPKGRESGVGGALAIVLALLMGNLDALSQFLGRVRVVLAGEVPPGFDYWTSSRVIPETINEFPYWTFLFADLHPHLIALPFGLLVVGLAASWVLGTGVRSQESGNSKRKQGNSKRKQGNDWREQENGEREQGNDWREQENSKREQVNSKREQVDSERNQVNSEREQGNDERWQVNSEREQGTGEREQGGGEQDDRRSGGREQSDAVTAGIVAEDRAGEDVVIPSPHHPVTLSPCHLVTLSPCRLVTVATCFLLALALGALGAINTWDLPTYLLLAAGALLIAGWRTRRAAKLFGAAAAAAVVAVAAVGAYWPFYTHYQSQVGQGEGFLLARYLSWVRAASPLPTWLTVWGILLWLCLSTLVGLWRWTEGGEPHAMADPAARVRPGGRLMLVLALIAALLTLVALERPTAALMALPAGLALPLAFRRRSLPADNFAALLLTVAATVGAGIELVYLRDFLEGGDWYRMNTLFKFSVPAWMLFGLACGASLPRLWESGLFPGRPLLNLAWRVASAGLIVAGLMFLPLGTAARVQDRFPERQPPVGTLNGMDYMTVGTLYWPDTEHPIDLAYDYLAIRWLLDHVSGTPVIAETPAGAYAIAGESITADYYRAGGLRVASFTGFPTLVGQHQYEQRPAEQVGPRTQLAQELFQTTDLARARELLAELLVSAVYVGPLERLLFSPDALRKFDVLVELGEMKVAYRSPQVVIYWASAR